MTFQKIVILDFYKSSIFLDIFADIKCLHLLLKTFNYTPNTTWTLSISYPIKYALASLIKKIMNDRPQDIYFDYWSY